MGPAARLLFGRLEMAKHSDIPCLTGVVATPSVRRFESDAGLRDAIMSTSKPTLRDELAEYNQHLDDCLRSRFSMSLKTFKSIKATTQLVGVAAGVYAMQLGAAPLAALAMMTVMVTGPEGLEYLINNTEE